MPAQQLKELKRMRDEAMRIQRVLDDEVVEVGKKGVKVKIIAPVDKKAAKKINFADLKDAETKIRFVNIDNKELLFMLSDDNVNPAYDSAIWVDSEFFTKAVQSFVDSYLK